MLINYDALLMRQLSRQNIDYVAHCIGDNEKEFQRLMTIVLFGNEPLVQRAAWAMDACLEKRPELLSPYVETLVDALPKFSNNGVKRQVVKALSGCDIPERLEGQLANLCFEWIQSSTVPVAIKIHCMQILANITVQHPDLAGELRTVINEQMPRNSAGFSSRGRKILKQIYMKKFIVDAVLTILFVFFTNPAHAQWVKYENNPVLGGGNLGTVFDISVLKNGKEYVMYSSWRPKRSVAISTSADGKNWTAPEIVLGTNGDTDWEDDINRPSVLLKDGVYHLWYTGQYKSKNSWIGYATSKDGKNFVRQSDKPVVSPTEPWEKVAVMCPHVIWDEKEKIFKMWYSGGEQYEPDAIGYATSKDGLHWEKRLQPVFVADPSKKWENYKVTACQVIKRKNDYLMFYIGFRDIDFAQIGMARSKNGIDHWERYQGNPIISPIEGTWDASACYKPFAIQERNRWMLWYNGRNEGLEQIGLAIHQGTNLGF